MSGKYNLPDNLPPYDPSFWTSLPFKSWEDVLDAYYAPIRRIEGKPEAIDLSDWPVNPIVKHPFTTEDRLAFSAAMSEYKRNGGGSEATNPFAGDYQDCLAIAPLEDSKPKREKEKKRKKSTKEAVVPDFEKHKVSEEAKPKKASNFKVFVPENMAAVFISGSQIVHYQLSGKNKTVCGKKIDRILSKDELTDPMYTIICMKCRGNK